MKWYVVEWCRRCEKFVPVTAPTPEDLDGLTAVLHPELQKFPVRCPKCGEIIREDESQEAKE